MTNIVMLCRGRFRLLAQALESLQAHTEPEEYNLTIVHDSQEDDFRVGKLLRNYASSIRNVRLVDLPNSSHILAQMKNLGVAASEEFFGRGDWLYLSDSDVWFGERWLERLTKLAECTEFAEYRLWGGQIHPFHQEERTAPIVIEGEKNLTEHSVLDGPSWLMRWGTWKTIGGFERTCASGVCQSDETPFCRDVLAHGGRIGVASPHVIVHCGLTQYDGKPAPGAEERKRMIPQGVLAE